MCLKLSAIASVCERILAKSDNNMEVNFISVVRKIIRMNRRGFNAQPLVQRVMPSVYCSRTEHAFSLGRNFVHRKKKNS